MQHQGYSSLSLLFLEGHPNFQVAHHFHLLPKMPGTIHTTTPPERIRPCDLQKRINSLKLKKACGIDGIPNECLSHLPRRPLVHLTQLFNLLLPVQFSKALKGNKNHNVTEAQ
jgi:hypothetical protein